MNFASMHNDHLDPDRFAQQEPPTWWFMLERISRVLMREFGSWGRLYKSLYKGTDCGVTVCVEFNEGEEVYNDRLNGLGSTLVARSIRISSIVEGVEQCTTTHAVDLRKIRSGRAAIAAIYAACDAVEKEAEAIWNQTHGCPACAKAAGFFNPDFQEVCAGDDGVTPVNPKCPSCKGCGTMI